MLLLSPILLEADADYMSQTTAFFHLFVMDVAKLAMYVLEFLSVVIIVFTTVIAFYKLFKHKPFARVYLLHGQSVGLSFKLGAEILRTVVARNINDIWEIFLLIIIKACMVLLIEWELKGIEDPYSSDGFEHHDKSEFGSAKIKSPFHIHQFKDTHETSTSTAQSAAGSSAAPAPTVEELQAEINALKQQVAQNKETFDHAIEESGL